MNTNIENLKIKDLVPAGGTAVSSDDGDILFAKIKDSIQNGKSVELDFSGVTLITTAYLNSAIGQLYSLFTSDQLNNSLKLKNVADEDKILFKRVILRAKEYFAHKKGFEDSADNAFYGG